MIKVNLEKAKVMSHILRKEDRADKMKQLDIEVTIPSMAVKSEAKRQIIRDANAQVQDQIQNAKDVDELKGILRTL